MQRPSWGLVRMVAVLSPLSLVLAHNLVFLLSAGDEAGAVLAATGHDGTWFGAVRMVIAGSALLGLAAAFRIAVLWRTARRLERETGQLVHPDWRAMRGLLLRTWAGIALVTTLWFVLQENSERLSIGEAAPLLGPLLDGGIGGPLLLIPLISLLTALVGTLLRWGVSVLLARIVAARLSRRRDRAPAIHRPAGRVAHPAALLARSLGLRAPPSALVTPSAST
jgi:hypothetical protein